MTAYTASDCTIYDSTLSSGIKELIVVTPATADDTDTVAIDLSNYGMKTILTIFGVAHSTEDSILVTEAPTTAVSGTTVTITIGGSTDNLKRVYTIRGTC